MNDTAPQFPLPRAGIGECSECVHWCDRAKSEVAFTAQGPVPIEQVRQQGVIYQGPRGVVAPCTLNPVWHPTPANWWCGQWQALRPS